MSGKRPSTLRQSRLFQSSNGIDDSSSNSTSTPSSSSSSSILDAAALQSEMMKKYGMIGSNQYPLPKATQQQRQQQKRQAKERKALLQIPTCPSCHHQLLPPNPPPSSSSTASGAGSLHSSPLPSMEFCEFCGYFLQNSPKPELTLAQKRGLVPIPNHHHHHDPLKPLDWYVVERSIEKKIEPDAFCPICMGPFLHTEEVLLSCGHIFHKICLRSFENFVKNQDVSCPICRTKHYQKKMTGLGSLSYQKVCIVKIQRIWRGYSIRKNYHQQLKQFYKDGNGNEIQRKKFFEQEFISFNNKIDKSMNDRSHQVNSLLRSMDQTLIENRQLDVLFAQMLADRSNREQNRDQQQLTVSDSNGSGSGGGGRGDSVGNAESLFSYTFGFQGNNKPYNPDEIASDMKCPWSEIAQQTTSRGACDCAICMVPIQSNIIFPVTKTASSSPSYSFGPHPQKKTVLLSCSHVFHEWCITSFEKFSHADKACPICRSHYEKRLLPS